jgi:4-diphosphocytidyl-2-C-methyl-D-erythritol kinase
MDGPPMKGLALKSFAKLNLGLEVLGVREDGYHELRTIFQTIALHDDVVLRPRRDSEIRVTCDHPRVPKDETNLAVRAARELQRYARRSDGLDIVITKRIPVAGGLGGGSSNAAAVLMGLDRLWKLKLGRWGLQPLAVRLGADVPYFLVGGTALGLARGEEVYPLHLQVQVPVVLVDPEIPVSTAAVFKRIDARLTPRENSYTIFRFVSRHLERSVAFGILENDLEPAALEEAPALAEKVSRIRTVLTRCGAQLAALSGSGSAYFGLFGDPGGARKARAALVSEGFRAIETRTVTLARYRTIWSSPRSNSGGRTG